jgi:nucleotide-binding universal stress UspA family protein
VGAEEPQGTTEETGEVVMLGPWHGLLTNSLVATDLSDGAELALTRALHLPCAEGARLWLLHAVHGEPALSLAREEEAELAHRLDEARSRAAAAADGLGVRSLDIVSSMVKGKASVEIVRAAWQQGSQLIVLGRHGKSAMRNQLLGSTAKGVIRGAGTSVLVVSQPVRGPYRRPLVAVDFSETSRLALHAALRFTERGTSSIDVVHAHGAPDDDLPLELVSIDDEEEARTHLAQFLEPLADQGVEWKKVIKRGNPRDVILDAAAWRGSDLIVLGARGHSEIDRAFIGSVAEAVVLAAGCDVLVVRSAEDSTVMGGES